MDWDRESRVRQRAFDIWNREGRSDGQADDHWARAELEVLLEENVDGTPKAGGLQEEPQVWSLAEAAAHAGAAPEAVPDERPADVAVRAGQGAQQRPSTS